MSNVVFIYGASRSGTTLLAKTLGMHSSIHQFQELHYFDLLRKEQVPTQEYARKLINRLIQIEFYEGLFKNPESVKVDSKFRDFAESFSEDIWESSYDELFRTFINWTLKINGKLIGVEQTGLNLLYDSQVRQVYHYRKVLAIVRSPYGVLNSQKNRWKVGKKGKRDIPRIELLKVFLKYNPWLMARLWSVYNRKLANVESDDIYLLTYEDLVSNPESKLKGIMRFIDLPFERNQLQVSNSGSSVRQESNTKGFDQSRLILNDGLNLGEKLIIRLICGNIMRRFGYDIEKVAVLPALLISGLYFLMLFIQVPLILFFNYNNIRDLIRSAFKD